MAQNGTVASGGSVDIVVASYETLRVYDAGGIVGTLSRLNAAGGWDVVDAIDHRNTGEARGWPGPATFRVAISAGSARYVVDGATYLGGAFDATAQGVASTALVAAQDYNRNSMVLMGDSRLAQYKVDVAGTAKRRSGANFITWAQRLTGQRLTIEKMLAASGLRSDQYLAEALVQQALACKSYWLMIPGILNDIAQNGDNDYWTTIIKPVVERWTATGRQVILHTETGAASLTTATQRGAIFKYNRQIRAYARQNRGVIIFDAAEVAMNPANSCTPRSGYSTDGTHIDTCVGGYNLGVRFAALVSQIIPPWNSLPKCIGEIYTNGGVYLFDNPVFTTTDSTAVGIMTGTKPTGVTSAIGPAGSSITSSIAAGAYGNDWTLAITAGGAGTVTVSIPPTSASYWADGSIISSAIQADIASGHSNFQGICLHQEANNGTTTTNCDDGYVASGMGNLQAGAYPGLVLETDLFTIPAGAKASGWYFHQLQFPFTAAGSATVTFRRLGLSGN